MHAAASIVETGDLPAGHHLARRAAYRAARAVAHRVLPAAPAPADVFERLAAAESLNGARHQFFQVRHEQIDSNLLARRQQQIVDI